MSLPQERLLSQEEVMCIVDVTEQSIERPNKHQQDYYSGKKKQKLSHDSHQNWIRSSNSEDQICTTFKGGVILCLAFSLTTFDLRFARPH